MSTTLPFDVADVFAAIDAMDVDRIVGFCGQNAELRLGNNPPMVGPDQIRAGLIDFFQAIDGLRHAVLNIWQDGVRTAVESTVTYDRLDGRQVTIPAVSVLTRDPDGPISSFGVYVDLTPVFAP